MAIVATVATIVAAVATTATAVAGALQGGPKAAGAPDADKVANPQAAQAPKLDQQAKTPDAQQTLQNTNGGPLNAGPGGGVSSTLLTGAGGVKSDRLTLGQNTLLGQ